MKAPKRGLSVVDSGRQGITLRVRGLVQGVGFRPTVWRLAQRFGLSGEVLNDGEGVLIRAFGTPDALSAFNRALSAEPPPLARIDTIECASAADCFPGEGFRIVESREGVVSTGVVPDAATCDACLADIRDPSNRRFRYPFTNCTHCGPRLSIVRAIPYDRATTSMASFTMCAACLAEYRDPSNRRFHAQPNACPACGPKVWLETARGELIQQEQGADPLSHAAVLIARGTIVAVKGLGGFHLACDASNEDAVARLRQRKARFGKPFALMARDVAMIAAYADMTQAERELLRGIAAPIVLLRKRAGPAPPLAPSIAPGQSTLGFILPYAPLHHLVLAELNAPIVLTSGNRSDEPQCTANAEARERLAGIADHFLMHNRDIVNRLDDSVARVMAGAPRVIRRARGFTPPPLPLPPGLEKAPAVLAMGAELKSTFCLLKDGQAAVSQHMGDLEEASVHNDYRRNLDLYRDLFRFEPGVIAVDAHPDYVSTQWGKALAKKSGLPLIQVQHHHAHIVAALAENSVPLNAPPVLGIALDGLGLSEDGALWGGEFLLADYRSYERLAHFALVPLIGGAKAMREPWRNTLAHLETFLGWENVRRDYGHLSLVRRLEAKPLVTCLRMMERGVNSPLSSSAGRLFDAVAAALEICFDVATYEGQAAIELEALADGVMADVRAGYPGTYHPGAPACLNWTPLWQALLRDLAEGARKPLIAARFHLGVIDTVVAAARELASRHGCKAAVLSGGVFQNKILFEGVSERLAAASLRVIAPSAYPANDGGVSLGQAVIAAARMSGTAPLASPPVS